MKVTVSFGDVRVIVPCGDGSLLVRDLIEKSKVRYRKASGKPVDHWIHVHTLKTASDDGILDPDDQLIDVADDREQIIAFFDEQRATSIPHNGGDGTSASSAGTASPDIFRGGDLGEKAFRPMYSSRSHQNDVLITPNDLTLGTNLTVRRGSEPSLNKIGTSDEKPGGNNTLPKNKNNRWSAIASIEDSPGPSNYARDAVYSDSDMSEERPPSSLGRIGEDGELSTFARDSARKSLGNMPGMYKWLDAHERLEDNYHQFHDMRKEPLGGHGYENGDALQPKDDNGKGYLIVMKNESGPLGIHVVPHYDEEARESGLVVQGIEPGGRIHRDGQLAVHDRIIEINEKSLMDVSFTKAQEVFKGALQSDEIRLKVIKHQENAVKPTDNKPSKQPPPTPPKPNMKKLNLSISKEKDKNDNITNPVVVPTHPQTLPVGEVPQRLSNQNTHPPSPNTHRAPPPVPSRAPETTLSSGSSDRQLVTNTRKIGKKIPIQLAKGPDGLGFSITTRDNPAGGNAPIYVKNILPKGAAITDGRLKSGDRLLEVNGVDLSDKSQTDAVGLLRNAKLGSIVEILVSRQVVEDRFSMPRKLDLSLQTPDQGIETDDEQPTRETIRLDIPLNETGSAGLGVSVKGKTQKREGMAGTIDVGIFVKAVMHGGAASKDGQLRVNDQLISVNGQSLIGKTNAESMELLRKSMQTEGPVPGYIQLVVSRKIGAPTPTLEQGGQFSYEHLGFDNKSPSEMDHDTSQEERLFKTIDTQSNSVLDSRDLVRKHSSEQSPRGRQFNDSVTLNTRNEESVMVEDDSYVARGRPRPHSTIGFVRPTPPDTPSSGSSHEGDGERSRRRKPSDMTMDDSMVLFSREGFGRQSMSEKRRGHIDAKQMDFYQKLKSEKGKEDDDETEQVERVSPPAVHVKRDTAGAPPPGPLVRVGSAESLLRSNLSMHGLGNVHNDVKASVPDDIGPTLGMKKSSSLESLQAMVKEVVDEEEDAVMWHGPSGVVRGRGCNESFRAAVDRSYDGPHVTVDQMESLAEEDSEMASSHGRKSATNSARSSMSFEGPSEVTISPKGGKSKAPKEKEKKGGIFKGLFKFGQKRKTLEITRPPSCKSRSHSPSPSPKGKAPDPPPPRQENLDQYKARVAAQEEQDRIQEHYRRLQEKQRQIEHHQPHYNDHHTLRDIEVSQQTREERIQQLRAEHQRKHQERQGRYPHEDKEEEYEEEIRESLDDEIMDDQQWGLYSEIPPKLPSSSSMQSQRLPNSNSMQSQSQQQLPSANMHSQQRLQSSISLQSQQRLPSSSSMQSQPQIYDGRPRNTPPDGHSYNNYQTFDEVKEHMERNDHYREQYLKYQEALHAQQMQHIRMEQQRQQQIAGKYGAHNGHEKPRSATPVNATGYMSQYNKKQLMGSLSASHAEQSKGHFDFDYDDPRHAYQEPQYAVVQRRNKQPGPAKV